MQKQRFITTIKNVTEKKKAQKLNWISFANKVDNYNRWEERERKKNLKVSTEQVKK